MSSARAFVARRQTSRPFIRLLGLETMEARGGRARILMPENPDLLNGRGDVHPGAIAALLDAAIAAAVRSMLPPGSGSGPVSITTSYLVPGRGTLTGIGAVVRSGETLVTVLGQAVDERGEVVAQGLATVRPMPSGR